MRKKFAAYLLVLLGVCLSGYAAAQDASGIMNMFGGMLRAAIIDHARTEWSKVTPNETSCIEQGLQQQGYSIDILVQQGIAPQDPKVSGIRSSCRVSTTSLPSPRESERNIEDISAKPTFDCTKARTATARIVCLDQAGAKADWDLISAYWARYFSLAENDRGGFDQAQQSWLESLPQACSITGQQSTFFPAQRQCVLTAYRNREAGYRSQLKGDALAESKLSPEQHAEIQQALITLGFLHDVADGEFGSHTRAAIEQFQAQSGVSEGEFLNAQQRQKLLQAKPPTESAATGSNQAPCRVMDPTGTSLNVRTSPNGNIVETLENGVQVRLVRTDQGPGGRLWSLIERVSDNQTIGWIYREYIDCASTIVGPEPPQQPQQPKDTLQLKEARAFLEDAKKFIAVQKAVPSISTIANEAANLQIALDKFDEPSAVKSMQKLGDLLKPIAGFEDFEQQQQAARKREAARQLAEARNEGTKNIFFVDSYMKDHLGDPKTTSLLNLREQINDSLKKNMIEQISKATDSLRSYINENGLADAYEASSKEFSNPTVPSTGNSKTLEEELGIGDKSKVVVNGPQDDVVLLYNISRTAPSIWKNVRGDIVFQNGAASLCFAQSNPGITVVRYIEHILGDQGAKSLTYAPAPCDLSSAASSIDIIAFKRGELLKDRKDYILTLVKMIEGDTFREYQIISDYASVFQKRQTFSLEIERDIENNKRKGFGAIAVTESPVACVITPEPVEQSDGIKELLKRNRDVIAPKLTSDWQFVDTNSDLAYLGLQRRQCGYVAGEASALRSIMLALRRDKINYTFSAVWWDDKDVDQAAFDMRDAREQEIRKQAEKDRVLKGQKALEEEREKNKQSQKTEIERRLREKNGVRARGLMNYIHDFVRQLAEKRSSDNRLFPSYSNWLNMRFANQWETYNVSSDVADFGTVQWNSRPLDAIIVKSTIQQKNRILGKYEDHCFMFGLVDDVEFGMERDPFVMDCENGSSVSKWKAGERFQSQWNAN
jgi:peptidoglycan hydrolase-like protein with peptidoglycan-binding domain/uncharacterized protein YecT (DUF1311 family)